MRLHHCEFPFEEIKDANGDYFTTAWEAMKHTHLSASHVWSVVEGEEDERDGHRIGYMCYGPGHHYVNAIGYIATKKPHDGNTYYEEEYEMGEVEEDEEIPENTLVCPYHACPLTNRK